MPSFKVTAKDGAGRRVERNLMADNRQEALAEARRAGLTVLSVEQARVGGGGSFMARLKELISPAQPRPHLKRDDLVVFTRQFATMISAGIPVLECVEILSEQADDPGFRARLAQVSEDVRSGSDLSEALSKHPDVFTNLYVNMVKAGEASGQLDEIFSRLAEYMEATAKLRREVIGAMTYPAISLGLITSISLLLMFFIVPKFAEIFNSMGLGRDQLPMPTRIVLGVSDGLKAYVIQVVVVVVVLIVGIRWWKKTDSGRYYWDRMLLKLPVFGPLIQKVVLSRFSRTFGTLMRSGVPVLGALEIVSATSGNRVVELAVEEAREAIRTGQSIAEPLSKNPVFPPMVVRMISVGERSGALEQLLEKISQFYDEQVSAAVESLTSLIEPIMLGVMGILVGGMVLAIFLPIFKVQSAIRGGRGG